MRFFLSLLVDTTKFQIVKDYEFRTPELVSKTDSVIDSTALRHIKDISSERNVILRPVESINQYNDTGEMQKPYHRDKTGKRLDVIT